MAGSTGALGMLVMRRVSGTALKATDSSIVKNGTAIGAWCRHPQLHWSWSQQSGSLPGSVACDAAIPSAISWQSDIATGAACSPVTVPCCACSAVAAPPIQPLAIRASASMR